jgi:predicted nucleotidyltransferase component of viral defense system
MIPRRELALLRAAWLLDQGVIEKDYVLGWLLAGIAQHQALSRTWVFKGGTCLRKCYYETFRFSEDLDFTVVNSGPEEPGGHPYSDSLPVRGVASYSFTELFGEKLRALAGPVSRWLPSWNHDYCH